MGSQGHNFQGRNLVLGEKLQLTIAISLIWKPLEHNREYSHNIFFNFNTWQWRTASDRGRKKLTKLTILELSSRHLWKNWRTAWGVFGQESDLDPILCVAKSHVQSGGGEKNRLVVFMKKTFTIHITQLYNSGALYTYAWELYKPKFKWIHPLHCPQSNIPFSDY